MIGNVGKVINQKDNHVSFLEILQVFDLISPYQLSQSNVDVFGPAATEQIVRKEVEPKKLNTRLLRAEKLNFVVVISNSAFHFFILIFIHSCT